jgi:DNA invertase Pin-like site-specific DNA recombinase
VYVRQSTLHQTRVNTESLARQYELVERARELGWSGEQIRVIDADLGMSGAAALDREGFQELVAEVALGKIGLILGIEASRLARRNADWYGLVDLCALTDTLIGDADGLYDPADYSDRLVLGLKGTIAEAELHLIKGRLIAGLRHKAAKGQLRINLPAGYDYGADGQVMISPDEAVRQAVTTVFDRFFTLRSIRQVALSLQADGLRLPRRRGQGAPSGPRRPTPECTTC